MTFLSKDMPYFRIPKNHRFIKRPDIEYYEYDHAVYDYDNNFYAHPFSLTDKNGEVQKWLYIPEVPYKFVWYGKNIKRVDF